ncbi:MAG: hypothetical protein LH485_05610 [Sphingomonas bacterium]|nr:hypothetical protein [Sphingomonas bacterium]
MNIIIDAVANRHDPATVELGLERLHLAHLAAREHRRNRTIAATIESRGTDRAAVVAARSEQAFGRFTLNLLLLAIKLLRTDVVALDAVRLALDTLLLTLDLGVALYALRLALDALRTLDALLLAFHALLLTLDALRTLDTLLALGTLDLALDSLRPFRALHLLTFDALRALDALRLLTFGALDLLRPFLALRALGLLAITLLRCGLLHIISAAAALLGRNRGSQSNAGNAGDQ